jgi:hypothetical protein
MSGYETDDKVPKCHKLAQKACIDSHDYTECALALSYCQEMLEGTFFNAGVNPYVLVSVFPIGRVLTIYPDTTCPSLAPEKNSPTVFATPKRKLARL